MVICYEADDENLHGYYEVGKSSGYYCGLVRKLFHLADKCYGCKPNKNYCGKQ